MYPHWRFFFLRKKIAPRTRNPFPSASVGRFTEDGGLEKWRGRWAKIYWTIFNIRIDMCIELFNVIYNICYVYIYIYMILKITEKLTLKISPFMFHWCSIHSHVSPTKCREFTWSIHRTWWVTGTSSLGLWSARRDISRCKSCDENMEILHLGEITTFLD